MKQSRKHLLSDEMRTDIIRLTESGWKYNEIANLLHISDSSVAYVKQAYYAAKNSDLAALKRLNSVSRPLVAWALKTFNISLDIDETPEVMTAPCGDDAILTMLTEINTTLNKILELLR